MHALASEDFPSYAALVTWFAPGSGTTDDAEVNCAAAVRVRPCMHVARVTVRVCMEGCVLLVSLHFFASKKIIFSGTVPEFSRVCLAKGGALIGAGMPAPTCSGTTMGADSSPPGKMVTPSPSAT